MVRRYERSVVRRGQIVDAARKVIINYGSEHVTVKRIASEVGISEAAIYRHFKNKRAVLIMLAENIEQNIVNDIKGAAREGYTPLGVLDSVLRSHLSAVQQREGISFQVIAEIISLGDKKLNKKLSDVLDKYIDQLKNLLAEGVRCGEVRPDINLEAAAMALFGIIQGLVNIWTLENYSFNPQERFAALWGVFYEAVIKR